MATLNVWHWERYVPTLGENKTLEKPFYLEVKAGISKAELSALMEGLDKSNTPDNWVAVFGDFVRFGSESLEVNGKPVKDLKEYVELAFEQANTELLSEMAVAVYWHNSVRGNKETFFARLSGGNVFTSHAPGAAKPLNGRETSR